MTQKDANDYLELEIEHLRKSLISSKVYNMEAPSVCDSLLFDGTIYVEEDEFPDVRYLRMFEQNEACEIIQEFEIKIQ